MRMRNYVFMVRWQAKEGTSSINTIRYVLEIERLQTEKKNSHHFHNVQVKKELKKKEKKEEKRRAF